MKSWIALLVSLFAAGAIAGCGNRCESKCKELAASAGKEPTPERLAECVKLCEKATK